MRILIGLTGMLVLAGAACSDGSGEATATENTQAATVGADSPLDPPAPGAPGGLPDDRTPVSEGDLDLKGPEGAGQLLQQYSALIEQRRFAEARALWTDGAREGETELQALFDSASEVHAQIGAPGAMEGAAGSVYVQVPYQLYGRLRSGEEFSRAGTMTLKRVNDVPGSTEEQRRWHIVRAELQ